MTENNRSKTGAARRDDWKTEPMPEQHDTFVLRRSFSNEEMDALLEQVRTTGNEDALQKLYSDIQMTVVNRLPVLGLLFRSGTVLSTRSIGGLSGLRAYDCFNGFEFLQ